MDAQQLEDLFGFTTQSKILHDRLLTNLLKIWDTNATTTNIYDAQTHSKASDTINTFVDSLLKVLMDPTGTKKNPTPDMVSLSYIYGRLGEDLFSEGQFDYNTAAAIRLTKEEIAGLVSARLRAGEAIRNLGASTRSKVAAAADSSQREYLRRIRQDVGKAVAQNMTISELTEALRSSIPEERDWRRVAATELHNARLDGYAATLRDKGDPTVYKLVQHDGCKHCQRLYGMPDNPKTFALSELEANGDNIGLKAADWKPVVGVTHPHCSCTLHELPDGWVLENGIPMPGN